MTHPDIHFVRQEFEKILIETINLIDQDTSSTSWKTFFGKDTILRNLQFAYINFKSISILCENNDEALVISATPISRVNSEILFGVIYIFENFEKRTFDAAKSLVREGKRELRIFKERYSDKSNEWNNWINDKPQKIERIQNFLETEFSSIRYREFDWDNDKKNRFPRLSQMKDSFPKDSETIRFLNFLEDVYSRELSGISHAEPQATVFLGVLLHNKGKSIRANFRSRIIGLSFIVLLSLVSEIESNINYGVKLRLKEIWHKLTNLPETDVAKEFYDMRYKKLLET